MGGDRLRGLERALMPLLLGVIISAAACSPNVGPRAVLGRYVANHNKGLDVIELKQDGTYAYVYRPTQGEEFRNAGRWTFYYKDEAPRITFRDFVFGLKSYGGLDPGYWDVEVERSWDGRLRLALDADLNYYYVKQDH